MIEVHGPSRRYLFAKRVLDVVLCSLALLVAIPVILCARSRSGSTRRAAMFAQPRTGRDGRRFRM